MVSVLGSVLMVLGRYLVFGYLDPYGYVQCTPYSIYFRMVIDV